MKPSFKQFISEKILDAEYVNKLWELSADLPVKNISIDTFKAVIEEWLSSEIDTSYENKKVVKINFDHFERIRNAELKYPIILGEDGRVLDGMHRILKVWFSGANTIRAVKFDRDPE